MTLTWILASVITIPMGWTIPNTFYRCWEVAGLYNVETTQIYLCNGYKEWHKYHEIAHYYWFEELTDEELEEYNQLFKNSKTFFREYSSTSVKEDFADAYWTYKAKVSIKWYKITPEMKKRQRLAHKLISKYY